MSNNDEAEVIKKIEEKIDQLKKKQEEENKENCKHRTILVVIFIFLFPVWFFFNIFIPLKYTILPVFIMSYRCESVTNGLSALVFILSPSIWDIFFLLLLLILFIPCVVVIVIGIVAYGILLFCSLGAMGESL
jgi:hypothetical protein